MMVTFSQRAGAAAAHSPRSRCRTSVTCALSPGTTRYHHMSDPLTPSACRGLCRCRALRILSGDIEKAVATALDGAGSKNLEILGADVASQCLQRGLVDEILVYVLPVLLGDGIRFSSPRLPRIDLEPVSSMRSGAVTILRFRVRKQSDG